MPPPCAECSALTPDTILTYQDRISLPLSTQKDLFEVPPEMGESGESGGAEALSTCSHLHPLPYLRDDFHTHSIIFRHKIECAKLPVQGGVNAVRTARPDVIDREDRPGPPRPTHSRSHGIMPTSQSPRPRIDISDGACEVTHQAQRRQGTRYTRALEACSQPWLAHRGPCRVTEVPTLLPRL